MLLLAVCVDHALVDSLIGFPYIMTVEPWTGWCQ